MVQELHEHCLLLDVIKITPRMVFNLEGVNLAEHGFVVATEHLDLLAIPLITTGNTLEDVLRNINSFSHVPRMGKGQSPEGPKGI